MVERNDKYISGIYEDGKIILNEELGLENGEEVVLKMFPKENLTGIKSELDMEDKYGFKAAQAYVSKNCPNLTLSDAVIEERRNSSF